MSPSLKSTSPQKKSPDSQDMHSWVLPQHSKWLENAKVQRQKFIADSTMMVAGKGAKKKGDFYNNLTCDWLETFGYAVPVNGVWPTKEILPAPADKDKVSSIRVKTRKVCSERWCKGSCVLN
jgi:hypothetical protein